MNVATAALSLVIATTAFAPVAEAAEMTKTLTPFQVTSLAYRGSLSEAGIPGYGSLESGIATGDIVAEDVIEAAIASGRLSAEVLDNSAFVSSVDNQLDNLVDRGN
ncbi:hypothetical protein [Vacuolonema iberomarrocanum]|uniref:hypothetical protein n=1 Tax=Vacuolonema iberomarrocanum TaxID=3454632 RepID=UPI0019FBB05D|nr:hypothetical protein [filamentous cyanobacterium LEGE 07170]